MSLVFIGKYRIERAQRNANIERNVSKAKTPIRTAKYRKCNISLAPEIQIAKFRVTKHPISND